MQIIERINGGVIVLDLKGKITLGDGDDQLKNYINSLLAKRQTNVILNLESVPYVDAAGMGEIVRAYSDVLRQGGQLKLLNVGKRIYDYLVITKLSTLFDFFEDEAEALRSYS